MNTKVAGGKPKDAGGCFSFIFASGRVLAIDKMPLLESFLSVVYNVAWKARLFTKVQPKTLELSNEELDGHIKDNSIHSSQI